MNKEPSQFVTTFEIRRNGFVQLRIEHDSKRHGLDELCVIFFNPEGERAQRMTLDGLEQAILQSRKLRGKND